MDATSRKCCEASFIGADGVVTYGNFFSELTTPSAPLLRLRGFFLLAQPPLLTRRGNAPTVGLLRCPEILIDLFQILLDG